MIGIFDSGLGGLSVLRHIRALLPNSDLLYVADRARAPYGTRSLEEVAAISREISGWLIDEGASCIVVACNTASAAALYELRRVFSGTRFVGMEPAVKPAAVSTSTGIIGVLATEATFQGELYESVVRRYAKDKLVVAAACPDWVRLVEQGDVAGPQVTQVVRARIAPLLEAGTDTLVLGCTHFAFLQTVIREVSGPDVALIDPGPAVARQTARVHPDEGTATLRLFSSTDPTSLVGVACTLAGIEATEPALPFSAHAHL